MALATTTTANAETITKKPREIGDVPEKWVTPFAVLLGVLLDNRIHAFIVVTSQLSLISNVLSSSD